MSKDVLIPRDKLDAAFMAFADSLGEDQMVWEYGGLGGNTPIARVSDESTEELFDEIGEFKKALQAAVDAYAAYEESHSR